MDFLHGGDMNMMDIIIEMLEEENKKCSESLERHIKSKDKVDFNQYLKYHHRAGVLIELAERCLESLENQ